MSEALAPDLCVIGAGAGGLSIVAAAAAMGVPTVLIEKGPMGAESMNSGGIAAPALLAAARAAQDAREMRSLGVSAQETSVDFGAVMRHVRACASAVALDSSEARLRGMGVQVIRAQARFIAPDRVEAGGAVVRARRFVVATGSSPVAPNIPGLEQIRYLTEDSIFTLEALPEHLVVLGGSPAALELAQAFRRLGARVTLLEPGRAAAQEDEEFADLLAHALRREGIDLRENANILRAEATAGGFRLHLETGEMIEGDRLLAAAGRRPNVEGLGLEAAGVRRLRDGALVGADLRTSNRRIYCIGDAAGGAPFAHAASHHAALVARATLLGVRARLVPSLVPRVVRTDPGIASTGLSEAAARKAWRRIRVLRWPLADTDAARAEGLREGHVKLVLARNGRILGAAMAGRDAGEMIGVWQLAISRGLKIQSIADLVLPYPTLNEASKRAAMMAGGPAFASRWLRALLGLLRKFG